MITKLQNYLKAFTALAVTFLAMVQAAELPGSPAGGHLTSGEWLNAGVAALVALGAVWAVPNTNAPVVPTV